MGRRGYNHVVVGGYRRLAAAIAAGHRDHHSLDADGRALTNGLGCEALLKTLRVLLKSHPDPKGVEILEVSNAPEEARG